MEDLQEAAVVLLLAEIAHVEEDGRLVGKAQAAAGLGRVRPVRGQAEGVEDHAVAPGSLRQPGR